MSKQRCTKVYMMYKIVAQAKRREKAKLPSLGLLKFMGGFPISVNIHSFFFSFLNCSGIFPYLSIIR